MLHSFNASLKTKKVNPKKAVDLMGLTIRHKVPIKKISARGLLFISLALLFF